MAESLLSSEASEAKYQENSVQNEKKKGGFLWLSHFWFKTNVLLLLSLFSRV